MSQPLMKNVAFGSSANSTPGPSTAPSFLSENSETQRSRREAHQVHRRESSKWIPPAAPLRQRLVMPIQRRFDKTSTDNRLVTPNFTDPPTERYNLRSYKKFCSNKIATTKYTFLTFLPKNLKEQMHRLANVYFLFIVGINWIPALQAVSKYLGIIPVAIILLLTALKDAFEDYRRHLADQKINAQTVHVWSAEKQRFRKMPWEYVLVGDLVHLSNDETIPADMVLVRSSDPNGSVFIETSNLDGENNLKHKTVLPGCMHLCEQDSFDPSKFNVKVYCPKPDSRLNFINGSVDYSNGKEDPITLRNFVVRGCQVRNTIFVEGVVLYTGRDTKPALSNNVSPSKQSSLERTTNVFVIYCIGILICLITSCGLLSIFWLIRHSAHNNKIPYIYLLTNSPISDGLINMASYIISFQTLIPLSLYITVELIKLGQMFFLSHDMELYYEPTDTRAQCRSLTIPEELGQIQYVLSDKTGTLTENKMLFKCCSINGDSYEPSNLYSAPPEISTESKKPASVDDVISVNDELKTALPLIFDNPEADYDFQATYYFFLNLAICNTVMAHRERHKDNIDEGFVKDGVFHVTNSAFYVRPEDYPSPEVYSPTTASVGSSLSLSSRASSFLSGLAPPIFRRLSSFNGSVFSFFKRTKKFVLQQKKLQRIYEAESPDEYCLVNAARTYGVTLMHRSTDFVEVALPSSDGQVRILTLQIAKILEFDANRKRMSIVVHLDSCKLLLCKGADDGIFANLSAEFATSQRGKRVINQSKALLQRYASNGLRTLCMAMRIVDNEVYNTWLTSHEYIELSDFDGREESLSESASKLEVDLELLGLTAIEDRLQEGVPDAIASLRMAGMQVWVLTGDKEETALNIATSCQLFDSYTPLVYLRSGEDADYFDLNKDCGAYNVVVSSDGVKLVAEKNEKAIGLIRGATSVLCYRMTPSEKATIVRLVKKRLKGKVLAVGDGANDVPMIQAAHVGIGISGQEGMQAVMASDFALARFRFLKRLLLVHGHWFYYRLANVLLHFLYKNAMLVLVIYWGSYFSGFSAHNIIDPIFSMLYPIIFTSVQPLVYGILDQDISAEVLEQKPLLYAKGRTNSVYKHTRFLIHMMEAFWQSAVVYFVGYGTFNDFDTENWIFGFYLASGIFFCNEVHLVMLTRCWTMPLFLMHFIFIAVFYVFFLFYTSFSSPIFGTPSTPVNVASHCLHSVLYWAALYVSVVVALAPRYLVKIVQNTFAPGLVYATALKTCGGTFTRSDEEHGDEDVSRGLSIVHPVTNR